MAQIKTKFIEDGAITNAKVASGIDAAKLGDGSVSNTEFQRLNGLTGDIQSQLDAKVDDSEKGAAGGVATLDGGGKVPASQLPNSVMEFKGLFDPATATFTDGTGNAGDVWQASAAGSYDAGSGSITYAIGDWAVHSGSVFQKSLNSNAVASVNGFTGIVVLDSDDVAEGSSNLYFSNERAQDAVGAALTDTASIDFTYNDGAGTIEAAVLPAGVDHDALANFVANEHVDHSTININTSANSGLSGGGDITASRSLVIDPNNATSVTAATGDLVLIADVSDSNNLKKVTAQSIADLAPAAPSRAKQTFVLSGTDITNQYVTLSNTPLSNSVLLIVKGGGAMIEGASYDYSISGAQLNFLNDLATGGGAELVATDVLQVSYLY